jgi:hypothetical protein
VEYVWQDVMLFYHGCTVHLDIIKVFFILPTDALCIYYIKIKIYIKIHTEIASTCFGLTTILREHIIDLR